MLKIENLHYSYPNGPELLKNISFTQERGEVLAILGNNGVGKSTMLKCINKIIVPNKGSVMIDNSELMDMTVGQIAKKVAFVAQHIPNTQMLVHDMVKLGRKPYMGWGFTQEDYDIVENSMDSLGIMCMKNRFVNELSGGERQKVMLARALAQQPKLLLLDEPTSNLDIQNQHQVLQIVKNICKKANIMAMVVIHDINLALRFCDKFLLIKEGQVYDYGGPNILTREAIWDIYNINGQIVNIKDRQILLVD